MKKLERKNLEHKLFRLNLTSIEGDSKLDRIFYGAELKPLSFQHGKIEVRKLKGQLGLFSKNKCKNWAFWLQVMLKEIFLAKIESKTVGRYLVEIHERRWKNSAKKNLAPHHAWNNTNMRQETTCDLKG